MKKLVNSSEMPPGSEKKLLESKWENTPCQNCLLVGLPEMLFIGYHGSF